MKMFVAALSAALVSGAVMAEAQVCKMGDMVRKVEVVHVDGDASKPCDVQYTKETEMPGAPAATLWHYDVQVDQCALKAQELVAKLQGWGWTCSTSGSEATAAASEESTATE